MKNRKLMIALLMLLVLVLLTGAFFVVFLNIAKAEDETMAEAAIDVTSFSAYTEVEEFQDVPAMIIEGTKIGKASNFGGGTYLIDVSGTTEKDYDAYLKLVEKAGFKKHSANGEDKMEGYAKTASFTKDDITLTVSQAMTLDKTYITATKDLPLSEHLIYQDAYVADNITGAKTKLYLLELVNFGNSYVIQLKNGHFVLYDGGASTEAKYLIDFLEGLVPEGDTPIIEGWFISHAHVDHFGAMTKIASDLSLAKRLIVDGIYFTEPPAEIAQIENLAADISITKLASRGFKDQNGNMTKLYRPQFGQRYYFNDIYIDVSLTPEQYADIDSYYTQDFNDSSIWLKAFIEGQTFLCGGDSSHTGARMIVNTFDKSYCDVTFFSVLHHAINVYDYFTDFLTSDVALYTTWRFANTFYEQNITHSRISENEHLQESVKESYHYGNGTVAFTFPYTVGTAETLPKNEWIYGDKPVREGTE